ncbi:MAG: Ig-like domain-containing protein, partial [Verrucomicrobia subdivision 3 bacterium]|nr:Ig-like domain-containing protein [Limisphaerales bacterium]
MNNRLAAILIVAFAFPILTARSAQHSVVASGFSFVPPVININVGDTIVFSGGANFHTVTGSSASEAFCGSGLYTTCMVTFDVVGSFPYHCIPHRSFGMTGLVNVAGANLPPTVTLTSPTNGSVFSAPGRFTISANAMDTGGGTIGSVQFFAGATSLGSDTDSPYQVAVSNLAAGMYVLTARARDNQNAMA